MSKSHNDRSPKTRAARDAVGHQPREVLDTVESESDDKEDEDASRTAAWEDWLEDLKGTVEEVFVVPTLATTVWL